MNVNDILLNMWDIEKKKEASGSSEGHASLFGSLELCAYSALGLE